MGSWVGARLEGLTGWCSGWASACLAAGPWKGEGVGSMAVCVAGKEQGPLGRQGHSLGHFPLSLSCGLGHWRRWWRWRQRPMRKDHHRNSGRWGEGLNFKEQKSELGSEGGVSQVSSVGSLWTSSDRACGMGQVLPPRLRSKPDTS